MNEKIKCFINGAPCSDLEQAIEAIQNGIEVTMIAHETENWQKQQPCKPFSAKWSSLNYPAPEYAIYDLGFVWAADVDPIIIRQSAEKTVVMTKEPVVNFQTL